MPAPDPHNLNRTLQKLALEDSTPNAVSKGGGRDVADSWEDEANDASDSETEIPQAGPIDDSKHLDTPPSGLLDHPAAPPPTPVSPLHHKKQKSLSTHPLFSHDEEQFDDTSPGSESVGSGAKPPPNTPRDPAHRSPAGGRSPDGRAPDKRPEKTTAPAARMIAGALGVRAPKRTEEQKAYDKAAREQEVRRRDAEREQARREAEEKERMKKQMWDD